MTHNCLQDTERWKALCRERGVDVDFDFISNYQKDYFNASEEQQELENKLKSLQNQMENIKSAEGKVKGHKSRVDEIQIFRPITLNFLVRESSVKTTG